MKKVMTILFLTLLTFGCVCPDPEPILIDETPALKVSKITISGETANGEVIFIYDADGLLKTMESNISVDATFEFVNNKQTNNLTQVNRHLTNSIETTDYTYDGEGRVIEMEGARNDEYEYEGSKIHTNTSILNFQGGNLTERSLSNGTLVETTTFDDNNSFLLGTPLYFNVLGIQSGRGFIYLGYSNDNNPLVMSEDQGTFVPAFSFVYEYNDRNYPTKITIKDDLTGYYDHTLVIKYN